MKKLFLLLIALINCVIFVNAQTQQINFHDTKGELNIDGSGAATYNIPIPLPPGVKDTSPQISLYYNSNTKNGIIGNGWSISGLSSITKTGKTLITDGINEGISYSETSDLEDNFSLDGQRLIKLDQYNYVTEQFSNLKIKAYFSGNLITSFEINYPDGSSALYGNYDNNNDNANSPISWSLTKWQDPNGNAVFYKYLKLKNSVYISEINWSVNKILFEYKPKTITEYTHYKNYKIIGDNLIKTINIYSNNTLFRKFDFDYESNIEKNDFLKKVTEKNGNNENSNPLVFNYNSSENKLEYDFGSFYGASEIDISNSSSFKMLGDYDGDGLIDLIYQGKLLSNIFNRWRYNLPVYPLENLNFKSNLSSVLVNNKLLQQNAIVKSQNLGITTGNWPSPDIESNFKLKVSYSYINSSKQLVDIVTKEIPYPFLNKKRDTDRCMNQSSYDRFTGAPDTKFIEGDFNGDGLSEIIILGQMTYSDTRLEQPDPNILRKPILGCNSVDFKHDANLYFVDLHKDLYVKQNMAITYDDTTEIVDFNGDGKQDIFTIDRSGFYRIYSLDKNNLFKEIAKGLISEYVDYTGLNTTKENNKTIIFGNFNSDNKTDILIPKGKNNNSWTIYESNGREFLKKDFILEPFKDVEYSNNNKNITQTIYYPVDINNDGRTDLVKIILKRYHAGGILDSKDVDTSFRVYGYTNIPLNDNITFDNTCKDFGDNNISNTTCYVSSLKKFDSRGMGVPILGKFKTNTDYLNDIIIIKTDGIGQLHKFSFNKDNSIDSQLNNISSSNGTTKESIEYTNEFVTKTDIEYPYAILKKLPNQYIVKRFNLTTPYYTKYKDFKYRDLTMSFNGLGFLGFRKVAQSNWIAPSINSYSQIWTVAQNDPNLRGVNILNWSFLAIRDYYIDGFIDNYKDTDLISKTTNSYKNSIINNRFYILPESTNTYDYISGITGVTTNTYDEFNNLNKSILTKSANGKTFKTTISNIYINTPTGVGSNYIIGRLNEKTTLSETDGNSYETKENFSYLNNNLISHITTVQNSEYTRILYSYDSFGNTLTVSNSGKLPLNNLPQAGTLRKIENFYDQSGRFLIKKIDTEKYATTYEYNNLGQTIKEIDKFGVTTTNDFDYWGKIKFSTISNNSTTPSTTSFSYYRDNNGWNIITSNDQIKTYNAQYFDAVGNNIKNTIKGFSDGQYVSTSTDYDALGRKLRESQPYFNSPSQWTNYEYDSISRPIKITNHTGLVVTNSYNGLTTTTKEGVRSKKITKDAIGNTSQLVDNGTETINYTYYPHGGVKTTTYGSHVITTGYDVWGRRTSLLDPSVSSIPYTYTYTVFDEIKEEKMPEGTTTYTYNNVGKITNKTTSGKSNIVVNYTYDSSRKGLLSKEYGTNEGNSFSNDITYDNFYRIVNRNEVTPKVIFGKQFVYDEFGRIMNSESWTMLNNKRVQTVILNHQYNQYNGELNLLLDISKGVGKVVWRANAKNERGQLLNSTLGELIAVENTYDAYGNITNIRNKKGNDWLYNVDYQYQIDRGLLTKRTDSHFGWEENFTYDSFDRLLSWSSPNGTNTNTYISDGRISENSQVGSYSYKPSEKYKKESIFLNSSGIDYYNSRTVQQITYDAFKRPLSIYEHNRGRVNFQYSINGGRFYALKQDLLTNKTIEKYYSQDGTMDISVDQNGNAKIINYISSPYDTPFIYVTETNLNNPTRVAEGFYYLARDFQGSITQIYDANANVIERRLFDPWGNIVKVQDINGNITEGENAKLIFLDRGYTGHEHFTEVGIIHMNGRIYDPVLKQFLSPDNFIQDPENSQSYNRYGYAWNNPLKYTDPSGEFFIVGTTLGAIILNGIIAGAIISSAIYTVNAIMTHSFGLDGFFKSSVIGGVMGGLGGIAAYYAPIGILPGLAYGTGTGGVLSVTSTFLNTGDITFKSFITGSAMGGIFGAMQGNIMAEDLNANPWTGFRKNNEMPANASISGGTPAEYDMKEVYSTINKNFTSEEIGDPLSRFKKFGVDYMVKHTPEGYSMNSQGYFVNLKTKSEVLAVTKYSIWKQGYSEIYFSKMAFSSKEQLYSTMAHEIGHAIANTNKNIQKILNAPGKLSKNHTWYSNLDTIEHVTIAKMTTEIAKINNWTGLNGIYPSWVFDPSQPGGTAIHNGFYNVLKKLFVRKITF